MAKKKPAKQPAEEPPLHEQVCKKVRALRKTRGWTLEQLASLSGVSRSMLSQIERGSANPTLGVAWRIANAFSMSLASLVETASTAPKIDVVRGDDDTHLFRSDENCEIRTLSPLHLEKEVEFYQVIIKPGKALKSAPHFEGTREFLTIEKGAVKVTSGDDVVELKAGDSAHYPADVEHAIENIGDEPALAFLVEIYGKSI